jgi:glycosyltransferase involved in cell wall biosynthesis
MSLVNVTEIIESIKNKTTSDNVITFAICISTYQRKNGKTPGYLTRCLSSILQQTYKNWKLYVYGDNYEDEQEFNNILSIVPTEKLVKHNMEIALERQSSLSKKELWCIGGVNTMNTVRQKAIDDGYEWICHLDDDDFWNIYRLDILNESIKRFPDICFISNFSTWNGTIYPQYNNNYIFYNNIKINPGCCIHSTFVINKRILNKFKFKTVTDYKENEEIEAGDWQFLTYLKNYLDNNVNEKVLFIPILLTYHPQEGESKN